MSIESEIKALIKGYKEQIEANERTIQDADTETFTLREVIGSLDNVLNPHKHELPPFGDSSGHTAAQAPF